MTNPQADLTRRSATSSIIWPTYLNFNPPAHHLLMASFLITGSSRGLGLALVSRLAALPKTEVGTIFATARQDHSAQLNEIVKSSAGRVELVGLDVTQSQSILEASKEVERKLQGRGLDYLINNAGVMDWSPGNLETM